MRVLVFIQANLSGMKNISTCCIDVDTITINKHNGTGRFLRISAFCIPNSELRAPMSDFRISERYRGVTKSIYLYIYMYIYIYRFLYMYIWYPPIDLGFCCASCPETNSFHEFGSKKSWNYW